MDPTQTPPVNPTITQPPTPVVAPMQPAPSLTPVKKNYKEIMSGMWNRVPPILRKVLVIFGIVFGLLILLGLVVSMGQKVAKKTITPVATATPVIGTGSTPVPIEIKNPSRYATDSGLLKIEEDIKKIDQGMGSVDLKELNLRPPDIQFKINFEE